ncbi:MAG TPA: hypothetical protein VFL66_06220 [Gaiellaceae bacterium]|nr:hypothetical protein [Gaiellaceae bacterium]
MDSLERLAYDAALRSLDKQERLLDEIRARTGVLVGVSSLAVSFLGRPAIESGRPVAVVALALMAFTASVGAGLYVLLPKHELVFALSGVALYEGLYDCRADLEEALRRLTYDLQRFWQSNDANLRRLVASFRLAGLALAAEVVLLVVAVSDTLF